MNLRKNKKAPDSAAQRLGNPWVSSTLIPGSPLAEQQATLLAVLHAGVRESLPLVPLIRSLATEYPGFYYNKLQHLAYLIDRGIPWIDALEQTPDALPSDTVLALRVGQQSGITLATFEELRAQNTEDLLHRDKSSWQSYFFYWMSVSLVMILMVSLYSYFIIPTMIKMMEEFGMERGTTNLRSSSSYAMLPAVTILGLTLLGIVLSSSERLRTWLASLLGIPSKTSAQSKAAVLRIVANAIQNGRPMAGTLSSLANFHRDSKLRSKLLIAKNEIEQGTEEWESMSASGLVTLAQKNALQGQSRNDQAWVLRSLARGLSLQGNQHWSWVQSFAHPVILITFGFAVLAIGSAFLDGLYSIVSELAKETHWR
jgi:type II secretory pathway component PulF